MWRKVADLGLKSSYDDRSHVNHADVKRSVITLLGLPFLPVDDVIDVFVGLRRTISPLVLPLWKYLDEIYVRGKPARGRRRPVLPLFPPALWNVHEAVLNRWHRTNNYVESWHSKFAKHMTTLHPNIWRFFESINKEQREIEQQIIQIRGGHRRIRFPLRKEYEEQNRIIETITANYDDYKERDDLETFLRAIAFRLKRPQIME